MARNLSGEIVKSDCKCDGGFENSNNELSVTQDSLFPSMKTTNFRFRMFCPVFGKAILKESSERRIERKDTVILLHWQQSDILINKFTEELFIILNSIYNFLTEVNLLCQ